MSGKKFTDADVKVAKLTGEILGKAKFNVDIKEAVDLYKCLAWLASLPSRIDDNVMEVQRVFTPSESKAPISKPASPAKKKKTNKKVK